MPIIGFGTWQLEGGTARSAVSDALELGYRHIDTASVYRNESDVGRAIADSGIARGDLFLTTKLPGNASNVRATMAKSLSNLGVDYVDLWLIHWPPAKSYQPATQSSQDLYEQMLVLRDEGAARAIGVSNYSAEEIDDLIAATSDSPEVDQIAWSPFRYDAPVQSALDARQIVLEGYSPLAMSRLEDPILMEIAASRGVTTAQAVLRWHVQRGVAVIPKSAHRERIRENFDVFGFALTGEDMDRLDALGPS